MFPFPECDFLGLCVGQYGHCSERLHQFSASYKFCPSHYLVALDYQSRYTNKSLCCCLVIVNSNLIYTLRSDHCPQEHRTYMVRSSVAMDFNVPTPRLSTLWAAVKVSTPLDTAIGSTDSCVISLRLSVSRAVYDYVKHIPPTEQSFNNWDKQDIYF